MGPLSLHGRHSIWWEGAGGPWLTSTHSPRLDLNSPRGQAAPATINPRAAEPPASRSQPPQEQSQREGPPLQICAEGGANIPECFRSPPPTRLSPGLVCGSALFRHEIGFVLGQMQHEACVPQLTAALESVVENPMVRHECAEALGSIAKASCLETLRAFAQDGERVVRESCEVALDMYDYANGPEFQYADGLSKLQASG